jgi:hypothetical protein
MMDVPGPPARYRKPAEFSALHLRASARRRREWDVRHDSGGAPRMDDMKGATAGGDLQWRLES